MELQHDCKESISQIKFSPAPEVNMAYRQFGPPMMAVTSWEGRVLTWQLNYNEQMKPKRCQANLVAQQKIDVPILGICWQ